MKTVLALALIALAVSGYETAAERERLVAAADDKDCRSYSAGFGTSSYIQCRTTKTQQHEMAGAELAAAVMSRRRVCTHIGFTTNCF